MHLEVVYRPAVSGLEVGGDWYDAFWLEPAGTLGVVVGDVVGRGIDAAATMGQLRSAVRALASTGLGPGALLDALDALRAPPRRSGQMATIVYAEVDLGRAAAPGLRGAPAAGARSSPAGRRACFSAGRSTPLDAHVTSQPRAQATLALAPGSTLVLYSDGLIERRDRPLNAGLDALLAALDRLAADGPAGLAEALARELLTPTTHPDDVCVLAVHLPDEDAEPRTTA